MFKTGMGVKAVHVLLHARRVFIKSWQAWSKACFGEIPILACERYARDRKRQPRATRSSGFTRVLCSTTAQGHRRVTAASKPAYPLALSKRARTASDSAKRSQRL